MSEKKAMRIVFMGTPEFAVNSLRYLVEDGWNIVGVITAPDRKAGRGQKLKSSAVKVYAQSQGLPILEPHNLKAPEFISELKKLEADLQVVVAFRMLPEMVWNMPPKGTINLHASLLPNYRGAAPINWAIINGETTTGLTTFFLQHEIDTGDILLQKEIAIDDKETAGSLHDKLMIQGGPLLAQSLQLIYIGNFTLRKQEVEQSRIKPAPKIFSRDCEINWNQPAKLVDAFIRGLSPYPTAWCMLKHKEHKIQKRLKVYSCSIAETSSNKNLPSEIEVIDRQIFIQTADQKIELQEIQLEGKQKMSAKDLLNGFLIQEYYLI